MIDMKALKAAQFGMERWISDGVIFRTIDPPTKSGDEK